MGVNRIGMEGRAVSHLQDAFEASDPNAGMNSAYCPAVMSFTTCAGHPGVRYIRKDVALAASVRDVDEAVDCAMSRGLTAQVVGETVWVDAPTPKTAIFALLGGVRVYDSRELAFKMTGRGPICVRIIARSYP